MLSGGKVVVFFTGVCSIFNKNMALFYLKKNRGIYFTYYDSICTCIQAWLEWRFLVLLSYLCSVLLLLEGVIYIWEDNYPVYLSAYIMYSQRSSLNLPIIQQQMEGRHSNGTKNWYRSKNIGVILRLNIFTKNGIGKG